jgi:hypothetical protein
LDENKSTVVKGFQFIIENAKDLCPNLREKKSFISFDEIIKKIQNKKTETSFI